MAPAKILIVDDQQGIRDQLMRWLSHEGYKTDQAANGKEALALMKRVNFHVVLLDLKLPDRDGYDLLAELHDDYPDVCIIALTAYGDDDSPAKARRAGAFDFFAKPIDFEQLINRIDAAIEQFHAKREMYYQQEEAKKQFQFENIIGESPVMQRMFELIKKIARSDETVLILGENGTGKDLVAGAIHYNSARKDKQLLVANCAALPETLAESELFGHEKGAFTGAISRKLGKFERANGTSLLIDEIGELSPQLQTKFLRFLQEKSFERVGGLESIHVDTRIIAVTNLDLQKAVKEKRFREDLYHRLSRVIINVPPLRERDGDLPLLIQHFIKVYNRINGKQIERISKSALQLLESYRFPGNVRELENMIANAILLQSGSVILPESIQMRLLSAFSEPVFTFKDMTYREARNVFERSYFSALLEGTGGNISQAARLAELDRSHFRDKLKRLGLISGRAGNKTKQAKKLGTVHSVEAEEGRSLPVD